MSNLIIKNSNNPITLSFTGVDLTQFVKVTAVFKSDSRNSVDNPGSVEVISSTELELNFQDTIETGYGTWFVKGENPAYPDGFVLTSACIGNLKDTEVC